MSAVSAYLLSGVLGWIAGLSVFVLYGLFTWAVCHSAVKPHRQLGLAQDMPHGPCYSSGQKFGQTMDVSQGCQQAEYQYAFWSTWLHAVMPAPHSHGCRLRVSLRAETWQSLQNCNFTAKNRPVFASICSTQQ
jgi:hypothetical protein